MGESPEYEAFEKCGPREVLVISSVGPWESVGGDIKFLRLKQLGLGGLVTDGSVRDTDEMLNYGFPVFSYNTTAKQGPAAMQPWECNGVMQVGVTNPVVIRPGDAVIGDQDGVVIVPAAAAEKVYEIGKSAFVTRPKLLDYTVDRTELLQRSGDVFKWLASGQLKVSVDKMFPLDSAVEGHDYLEEGKSKGKVLYEI